jgi:hypothetical protein
VSKKTGSFKRFTTYAIPKLTPMATGIVVATAVLRLFDLGFTVPLLNLVGRNVKTM